MFTRIRDILAEEYIGAIIIGMLTAQGIITMLGVLLRPLHFYLLNDRAGGVFGAMERAGFGWSQWLFELLAIGLYFVTAYALLLWVYARPAPAKGADEPTEEGA